MASTHNTTYRFEGENVYYGDSLVATFDQEWRARQFVEKMETPSEEFLYWQDVRDMASSIKSELDDQIDAGARGDTLREWLIEHIDESCDGAQRVIYTYKAQQCLLFSRNDGAYGDELGDEGMIEDGCVAWSKLAYCAFKADVLERLEEIEVDVNEPGPTCTECRDDQTTVNINGEWFCVDCAAEKVS